MAMSMIWIGMVVMSVLIGTATGNVDKVSSAMMDGAAEAVKFGISIGGAICIWSSIMEIMKQSGVSAKLACLLKKPLRKLFKSAERSDVLEPLAENVSANLLGLGNAATPAGIRAAEMMARRIKNGETSDDLCKFVVLNTASLQLIPSTVAAVRAAAGAENVFDILPAVWICSAVSVTAGLLAAKFLSQVWRKKHK